MLARIGGFGAGKQFQERCANTPILGARGTPSCYDLDMEATTESVTTYEIAKRFRNNEVVVTADGMKITSVREFGRARGFIAFYVEFNDDPSTKIRCEEHDCFEVRV